MIVRLERISYEGTSVATSVIKLSMPLLSAFERP